MASLVIHVTGFAALAAWSAVSSPSRPRFAGLDQTIQLTLLPSEPTWNPSPVELEVIHESHSPVVIQPFEARIAEQRFVHTPSSEITLPEALMMVPEVLPPNLPPRAEPAAVEPPQPREAIPREPAKPAPVAKNSERKPAVATTPTNLGNSERIPPNFSQNAPPTYPSLAVQRGWEGTVLLRVSIDAQGRVREVNVVRSSGHEVLDGAAAGAVRRWKGTPAYRGGVAVPTVEHLPVRFKL